MFIMFVIYFDFVSYVLEDYGGWWHDDNYDIDNKNNKNHDDNDDDDDDWSMNKQSI